MNRMKSSSVHLPLFQKFDCHSCGYCCRNLVVNISPAERQKIVDAGWIERMAGETLFIAYRFRGRKLLRLAHRPDGACVFLGEDGLCRLHKESGVAVKPLACRMYPFVPTPGAGSVRVDLRADCPSVAKNHGQTLTRHRSEVAGFIRETLTLSMFSVPRWGSGRRLTNEEFEEFVRVFAGFLSRPGLSFRVRFQAGWMLLDLLYDLSIRRINDVAFFALMDVLSESVLLSLESEEPAPALPTRAGRLFRQWLFLHAIADDPADLAVRGLGKFRRSWARYAQSRRFAAGTGPVPLVRPDWPVTTFEAVAAVGPAADEHLEPLCRSMQVKLDAHAFCGPGYYGWDVLRGLTALWTLPALVGWFARLEAVKAGHDSLQAGDVLAGLRRAHHTFGVSPVFARISERMRIHAFAKPGIVGALMGKYGP
jgi:lysine-N-methylase